MKAKPLINKKLKANKTFDTVQTFRKIKDKISKDMEGMSFEEIKDYLKKQSAKLRSET